ncbi:MAG: hypothetical protein ACK48K_20375, partial [Planctomycetota bacterium]
FSIEQNSGIEKGIESTWTVLVFQGAIWVSCAGAFPASIARQTRDLQRLKVWGFMIMPQVKGAMESSSGVFMG